MASLSCQMSAVPVQENTSPIVCEKPIFKLGSNLEWIPSFLDPDPNVNPPLVSVPVGWAFRGP